MKLVSYIELPVQADSRIRLGALIEGECVVDLAVAQTWAQGARGFKARNLPVTMLEMLRGWDDHAPHLQALLNVFPHDMCLDLKGAGRQPVARSRDAVALLPPLPNALSLRYFSGFEKHARNYQRMRSQAVPQVWYDIPLFTYGNPFTLQGPDQGLVLPRPDAALDYGLEVACFICRHGHDIPADRAAEHIAGYAIMNNWSMRDVELREVAGGVGPVRGRDFATTIGPALVTPDELSDRQVGVGADLRYDLGMTARVNSTERSRGNLKDIHWTFASMIAHASQGVTLYPGEIISSGAVASGTLFEQGAEDSGAWLRPGDSVSLEVERLGWLETVVVSAAGQP